MVKEWASDLPWHRDFCLLFMMTGESQRYVGLAPDHHDKVNGVTEQVINFLVSQ